ncbi:MAG: hypothetical protein U5K56_01675 [Halioglobus sp.]|nr:hypothetical protein [Halioglobus sp.]
MREGGRRNRRVPSPCADRRGELQEIATWAADLQRRAPATTIGIVMAGTGTDRIALEYLLRREFDCLGADYHSLPVNFSTGISLAAAPVVRDALAVLALALDRVAVPEVAALFRSRFLYLPDADTPLAQYFIGELYGGASEWIDVASLRHFAANVRLGEQQGLALGTHLMAMAGPCASCGAGQRPPSRSSRVNGIALREWGSRQRRATAGMRWNSSRSICGTAHWMNTAVWMPCARPWISPRRCACCARPATGRSPSRRPPTRRCRYSARWRPPGSASIICG